MLCFALIDTHIHESVQFHDEQIKAIAQVLRQMMEKPPDQTKGKIGFKSPLRP